MSTKRVTGQVEVCLGELMADGHSGLARTICRELGFRYDSNGCGLRDMRYRMAELVEGGTRAILRVSGIPEVVHPESDDARPENESDEPSLHDGGVRRFADPPIPDPGGTVKNPIQPVVTVEGVRRFKANVLVRALLDHGRRTGLDLNLLARQFHGPEHRDDHVQLAQLIGYSISGFGNLSYVDDVTLATVEKTSEGVDSLQARVDVLEATLAAVRAGMREAVATLYDICPEDLER